MNRINTTTTDDKDKEQRYVLGFLFFFLALLIASVMGYGVVKTMSGGSNAAAASEAADAAGAANTAMTDGAAASADAAGGAAAVAAGNASGDANTQSEAASVEVVDGVVKFYFPVGKFDLAPNANEALKDIIAATQAGKKATISGYHDSTGDMQRNAELAKQRAQVVAKTLEQLGVPAAQIELKKPANMQGSGSDKEARRVEVFIN